MGRLNAAIETTLYRVIQEGLNNVAKHAQARHVKITLTRTSANVRAIVRDDGIGFEVVEGGDFGGMGLHAMRERLTSLGGVLSVTSQPESGTSLCAEIPLKGT